MALRWLGPVLLLTMLIGAACAPSNARQAPASPSATARPAPATATQTPLLAPTAPASATSATKASQVVEIVIKDFAFGAKNAPVPVAVGTTVVWRNADDTAHTVTADDKAFDSGDMLKGAEFRHTFDRPGEYPYYCIWHGGPGGLYMASKIIVTP